MRHRHGDELLGFRRKGTVGEYALTESLERLSRFRSDSFPVFSKLFGYSGIDRFRL
jgi:hypothetical protein